MIVFIIALIVGLSLTSCGSEPSRPVTFSMFDAPLDSVKSELWFPELMAVNTRTFVSFSSNLCMVGPDDANLVYFVDEKEGKELGYAGVVGQGPEDMQPYPQYVGKSLEGDTLFLYDYNERKVNGYSVIKTENDFLKLKLAYKKSLLGKTNVDNKDSSYMNLCRLDNGYYVGISYFSTDDYFFTLLDKDLNVVKRFGEPPLGGLPSDGKVRSYGSFIGTLYARGNSVYYAANKFGYMTCYDISNAGEVTHQWSHQYSKVDYYIDKKPSIKFRSENTLSGFSDMTVGKKYIFATYSGIPIAEMFRQRSVSAIAAHTLVVFNQDDGAVLGRFKLNSKSFTVGLSENEEYLYVMNTDPEVQVMRINVCDILDKI